MKRVAGRQTRYVNKKEKRSGSLWEGRMPDFNRFLTMLSTEFQRYLMENEELGEKIPINAMVVFQVEG